MKPLFSSVAPKSFRGCSPSRVISQTSRDPNRLGNVVNTICEPSGATDQAVASSRIFLGALPNRGMIQMLGLPSGTVALARKLVLLARQAAIDHAPLASRNSG